MESEGKRWKTHETPACLIMLSFETPSRESQPHFTARQVKSKTSSVMDCRFYQEVAMEL